MTAKLETHRVQPDVEFVRHTLLVIGDTLDFMHFHRVAHHDLKPENVMVANFDVDKLDFLSKDKLETQLLQMVPKLKLIDLGVARQYAR